MKNQHSKIQTRKESEAETISLYEILNILKRKKQSEQLMKVYWLEKLNKIGIDNLRIKENEENQKEVYLKLASSESYEFYLTKEKNQTALKTVNETTEIPDTFTKNKSLLYILYDSFLCFYGANTTSTFHNQAYNANAQVDITKDYLKLEVSNFEITYYTHHQNAYSLKAKNNTRKNFFQHESPEEILKRIYLKIDDCPDWIKQELYQKRATQNLQKKQARTRKSFPFFPKQK